MKTLTLIRNLPRLVKLVQGQQELIRCQQALINDQNGLIGKQTRHIEWLQLEHMRDTQGLVCAWLIHLEQPEIDMRPELAQFETTLAHEVAKLEEHIL